MPLSNWDIHNDLPSFITVSIDTITPTIDDGSLHIEYTDSTTLGTINAIPIFPGYPQAIENAKLRTIFKVGSFPPGFGLYPNYFGIVAMQGTRNITGGDAPGKTCYALSVCLAEDLSSQELQLNKIFVPGYRGLQNMNAPQSEVLAVIPYPELITPGYVGTIELQWMANIPGLNGVFLVARSGSLTDYSDLTDRFSVVDYLSPLTVTAGEGLWSYMQNSISGDVRQVVFDNTSLYSLT